jgi:long-chain acyl-CoA synthetase
MTFATLPDRRAEGSPSGPALQDGSHSLDNRSLLAWVQAVAEQLAEGGRRPG